MIFTTSDFFHVRQKRSGKRLVPENKKRWNFAFCFSSKSLWKKCMKSKPNTKQWIDEKSVWLYSLLFFYSFELSLNETQEKITLYLIQVCITEIARQTPEKLNGRTCRGYDGSQLTLRWYWIQVTIS